MTRALPSAAGLQMVGALRSAKGIEIHFTPSLAIIAGGINKLAGSTHLFKEPLERSIREVVIPSIQENFARGGRPPWTPLAENTVARKGNDQKLIDTGALQQGMKDINIWTITNNYAVIQDLPQNIWYGKVHQGGLGTSIKTVKIVGTNASNAGSGADVSSGEGIPARPFVTLQKSDERKINSIFRHWIDAEIKATIGRL